MFHVAARIVAGLVVAQLLVAMLVDPALHEAIENRLRERLDLRRNAHPMRLRPIELDPLVEQAVQGAPVGHELRGRPPILQTTLEGLECRTEAPKALLGAARVPFQDQG